MRKSTSDRYGSVAITIHWLTAILIVVLLSTGFNAADSADSATKAQFLRVHIPVAVVVFLLTAFRVFWWIARDKKPDPVPGLPRWQEFLARNVHFLIYAIIFIMVASGIGMMALSGAGPAVFGGGGALPDFRDYAPRTPHGIGANLLVLLLVGHIGAALYHQFIRRDGLISRMWYRGARSRVESR